MTYPLDESRVFGDSGHIADHNQIHNALNAVHDVVADYGAKGDGTTDDTSAIQAALDAAAGSGGLVVGDPSHTYLITSQGTKTVEGTAHSYCLSVATDCILDLRGATLKLGNAENANLIINVSAGTGTDDNIVLRNIVLDGNQANQTEPANGSQNGILIHGATDLTVEHITARNIRYCAGRFLKVTRGSFDELICEDSDGDGWFFGLTTNSQQIVDSTIGTVAAHNCAGASGDNTAGNPAAAGNPVFMVAHRTTVDSLLASNCLAGFKIGNDSEDVAIGKVVFDGSMAGGSGNSGLKIQGNSGASLFPRRISIGTVVSYACAGPGLYIEDCFDVEVIRYTGQGNATLGTWPDVWIAGTRASVQSIFSEKSGSTGVLVRSDAADYHLAEVLALNPGISGSATSWDGLQAAGGDGFVSLLIAIDDQGTPTMKRGLNVTSAAAVLTIDRFLSEGHTVAASAITGGATVQSQIAQVSGQTLGFYGATPVVQPASVSPEKALEDLGLLTTGAAGLRNVKDYGAFAAAETAATNTTTLKAALDAGVSVELPIGSFPVNCDNFDMATESQRLIGQGRGLTKLIAQNAGTMLVVSANFCNVEGIYFDGNELATTCISVTDGSRGVFRQLIVEDATGSPGNGFEIRGTTGNNNLISVENVIARSNGGFGLGMALEDTNQNNVIWYNCDANANGGHGLRLQGFPCLVYGGGYANNGGHGIAVGLATDTGFTKAHIFQPYIEGNTGGGILQGKVSSSLYIRAVDSDGVDRSSGIGIVEIQGGSTFTDGEFEVITGAGGNTYQLNFTKHAILVSGGGTNEHLTLSPKGTGAVRVNSGGLQVKDGDAVPVTASGWATIYVDVADGDLKVKFGDGTVKTIVVDT